ncbi:NAD(P)/FAD-dependent oxidoreductase [uncultured Paludibaculum sp.]|uniref:NAD(P)/FAD-dependent oxidoreductase n=1 Tax=uncultured Paludibaculum sp. TaxID=1765020 RepID=UPI002AAB7890|nr:NAD(P)/FAD-dependent oxidoreductase [uncultured Paludibaculum sp.]
MHVKTAIIIGAGPAGLTAAYELLTRTGIHPIVLEKSEHFGGISRTANYKGNRIDLGGHRFFSKSDRVMSWWRRMLPLQGLPPGTPEIVYHRMRRTLDDVEPGPDPRLEDKVMLLRPRKSRIYFRRRLFQYPISLSVDTLRKLGVWPSLRIGLSYLRAVLRPLSKEDTLEDFFINRFGRELYRTFFQSYTEKVWGVPCSSISAAWGRQRVKGLSVRKVLGHAFGRMVGLDGGARKTETSLIEQFLYPKFGPGQMWEETARQVRKLGGEIHMRRRFEGLTVENGKVTAVSATNLATGETESYPADYFFSTAPLSELLESITPPPPPAVREVGRGLVYRDFITVGLLVKSLKIHDQTPQGRQLIRDNWIYIQEADVQVGRLQIYNNWSPFLVADPNTVWIGLEYFCNQTDPLWKSADAALIDLARTELARIGIIESADVLDATVLRVEKAYPAYFGTYDRFNEIRAYLDSLENLFPIGRNGMHRYNNQDHSMLTAMVAVDNILEGRMDKSNLWEVNTETDYQEEE